MRPTANLKAALIACICAGVIAGCSDGASTTQFGSKAGITTNTGTTDNNTTDNNTTDSGGSTTEPPDSFAVADAKTVALNNRSQGSFELTSAAIAYIVVNNPDQQAFDSWLMLEDEYQDYETARFALPQSANPSHQNYKAEYGIELRSSMTDATPVVLDLLPATYRIVIDNTELGSQNPFNSEEISYQFVVYAGNQLVLSSNDIN